MNENPREVNAMPSDLLYVIAAGVITAIIYNTEGSSVLSKYFSQLIYLGIIFIVVFLIIRSWKSIINFFKPEKKMEDNTKNDDFQKKYTESIAQVRKLNAKNQDLEERIKELELIKKTYDDTKTIENSEISDLNKTIRRLEEEKLEMEKIYQKKTDDLRNEYAKRLKETIDKLNQQKSGDVNQDRAFHTSNMLPNYVTERRQDNVSNQIHYNASTNLKKCYAIDPQNSIFHKVFDTFQPMETVYKITPTSETEGYFELVDDKDTLAQAFSLIDTLKDACDLYGTNRPSPDNFRYRNNERGRVRKEGDYWVITKKLPLEWD